MSASAATHVVDAAVITLGFVVFFACAVYFGIVSPSSKNQRGCG